jgi:site-specific recombinase XerD
MGREINQADHSPLFLNPSKRRASVVSLRTWIVKAGEHAGIKRHTNPHILRHSFATNSLDNKADIRDLQWYMGHKSLNTTSIYAHPTNKKVGDFLNINVRND